MASGKPHLIHFQTCIICYMEYEPHNVSTTTTQFSQSRQEVKIYPILIHNILFLFELQPTRQWMPNRWEALFFLHHPALISRFAGHFGHLSRHQKSTIELSEIGFRVKVIPAFRHVGCWIWQFCVGHHGDRTLSFNLNLTATVANALSLVDCKHNYTTRSRENDIQ